MYIFYFYLKVQSKYVLIRFDSRIDNFYKKIRSIYALVFLISLYFVLKLKPVKL